MKRTQEQNKTIYALLGKLGKMIGKENAEIVKARICKQFSGQEKSSDLTDLQARRVIDELRKETGAAVKAAYKPNRLKKWIDMSYDDLYRLMKVDASKQKLFRNNFNYTLIGKSEPVTFGEHKKLYDVLQEKIISKCDPEKIKAMIKHILGSSETLTDWELNAIWDYQSQLLTSKKLDSAAKIKKVIEIYRKVQSAECRV